MLEVTIIIIEEIITEIPK